MTDRCVHDHDDGMVKKEFRHMKDHWVSCLVTCLVIHKLLDLVEWLWNKL